jgi:hypothetical protein
MDLLDEDQAIPRLEANTPPYVRTVMAVERVKRTMAKSKGRYDLFTDKGPGDKSILAKATPELIGELVTSVLGVGDAVLFGVTRDGGSVRVILMSGDEKSSQYFSDPGELDDFCKRVSQHVRDTFS